MVKVTIINDNISFEVPKNSKIMDYIPDECSLMFGCRRGECGVCTCTIRKGEEFVVSISSREEETLRSKNAASSHRLMCQLWTKEIEKEGEIEIEY